MALDKRTAENDVVRFLEYWMKYRLLLRGGRPTSALMAKRAEAALVGSGWEEFARDLEANEQDIIEEVRKRGIDEIARQLALARMSREG